MRTRRDLVVGLVAGLGAAAASAFGPTAAASRSARRLPHGARWAVFYGRSAPEEAFDNYEVVVLDPAYEGDVAKIRANGAVTLGYLSLGEIARSNEAFARLPAPGLLIEENPNWPGAFAVDVRSAAWRRFLLRDLAETVRRRGFDGFFLDTLDTPLHLAEREPAKFSGMRAASARLVTELRRAFPNAPIMMNRAYPLIPAVEGAIDAVLAESLMGTFDFAANAYKPVSPAQTQAQLDALAPAKRAVPPLPVYALDYWDPADPAGVAALYAAERAHGHAPYVSTILLDAVRPEPRL